MLNDFIPCSRATNFREESAALYLIPNLTT
jgi:hypothetical protein